MPRVHVEPIGIDLEVAEGETLLHAAERLGYRWPTLCHGHAECTLCYIVVDDDDDALEAPGPIEVEGLRRFAGRTFYEGKRLRLACQTRPLADMRVTKRGVRPA